MTRNRPSSKAVRYAVSSAVLAALVVGAAGVSNLAARPTAASSDGRTDGGLSRGKLDRAVSQAEKTVAATPSDAALRLALGHAYLAAGRFESAAVTFDDAIRLGDESGPAALSLALALTGAGQQQTALGVLDEWRDVIPASDLGLALALAGEPGRGVAILADALRGGENTAKVRQNLAYAYALDGRWAQARLMASQDVPADQIDERIGNWAMTVRPDAMQARVATVLGVSPRNDPGQPQRLALAIPAASGAQIAANAEAAPAPLPADSDESAPAPATAASAELLPAYAVGLVEPSISEPSAVEAPALAAAPTPAETASFATAFPEHIAVARPATAYAAAPSAARKSPAPAPRPTVAVRGTHLVQLGAFSSPQNARRAVRYFGARNGLSSTQLTVTAVVINDRNFWRVAATGFTAGTAARMCSTVKGRGDGCFAYAATRVFTAPTLAGRGAVPRARR